MEKQLFYTAIVIIFIGIAFLYCKMIFIWYDVMKIKHNQIVSDYKRLECLKKEREMLMNKIFNK